MIRTVIDVLLTGGVITGVVALIAMWVDRRKRAAAASVDEATAERTDAEVGRTEAETGKLVAETAALADVAQGNAMDRLWSIVTYEQQERAALSARMGEVQARLDESERQATKAREEAQLATQERDRYLRERNAARDELREVRHRLDRVEEIMRARGITIDP